MRLLTILVFMNLLLAGAPLVSFSQSQPPPPGPLAGTKHIEEKSGQSNQIANQNKCGTEQKPLIVKMLPSVKSKAEADYETHERHEKSTNEWRLTWATIWLAIVTTFLAIFTAYLWNATRRLVIGAKDTAERQLRAYVNVLYGEVLNINDPTNRTFRIDIKNSGQTPAYNVSTVYKCIVREFPLDKNKPLEQITAEEHGVFSVLGPTCGCRMDMLVPNNGAWAEPKIKDGSAAIYCFGEIQYRDAFAIPRITEFRYMCQGDGIANGYVRPCEEGNNAT